MVQISSNITACIKVNHAEFPVVQITIRANYQLCEFPVMLIPSFAISQLCEFPVVQMPSCANSQLCEVPVVRIPSHALIEPAYMSITFMEGITGCTIFEGLLPICF